MSIASSTERRTDAEIETSHLFMLANDVRAVRTSHCRTGMGAAELRDDLDLLAEMATCQAVARRARRLIADIDRQWPHLAVA